MRDGPTKAAGRGRREAKPPAEEAGEARREAALHERSHIGVGIMEGMLSARPDDDRPSRLHRADEIAAVVLKVVTILALTFGLFEYDRQKADGRVNQSLELVKEWDSSGTQGAYTRINDAIWPLLQQATHDQGGTDIDAATREVIYANIGETITGRDDQFSSDADHDVDKVFQFFDRAATCADQGLCDYDVLKTFFGAESQSFWLYFSRYAERRQQDGYGGYANWTRKFIEGDIHRPKMFGLI
ncbi:MAG: hypothetical protein ABI697_00020 [Devosia sp.]